MTIVITICYGNQFQFLIWVLFARLFTVFKGTVYKLSNTTLKIYIALLIFQPISVCVLLYFTYNSKLFFTAIASELILGTLVNISIVIVFVMKLIAVAGDRKHLQQNIELSNVIAKNTLLAFISSISTVFAALSFVLYFVVFELQNKDEFKGHLEWIPALFESLDCFTNFIAIALSYEYFEIYYKQLCRFCHRKCESFYDKLTVHTKLSQMVMRDIPSLSGLDSKEMSGANEFVIYNAKCEIGNVIYKEIMQTDVLEAIIAQLLYFFC
eukprot:536553_1